MPDTPAECGRNSTGAVWIHQEETDMEISARNVKELRDRTGAGMMECKKALEEAGGEMEKAIDILRAKGAAKAAKRADREAREGVIGSYIHTNGRVGVLIEVNCETDFVARNDAFQRLVKELAMHVAAMNPLAINAEGIPVDEVERERAVQREVVRNEGKPENLWDKIVDGRMKKWFQEKTLLEQPFVREPDKSVAQLVQEVAAKTGENIIVRRFERFALGE
jgi:elongation factor Ts